MMIKVVNNISVMLFLQSAYFNQQTVFLLYSIIQIKQENPDENAF